MLTVKQESKETMFSTSGVCNLTNLQDLNNFLYFIKNLPIPFFGTLISIIAGIVCFWAILFWLPFIPKSVFQYNIATGLAIIGLRIIFAIAIMELIHYWLSLGQTSSSKKNILLFSNFFQKILLLLLPFCTIVLFSAPLIEFWRTGKTTYFHLGGLLPWTDSLGYYSGVINLLELKEIDAWNMRRPINAVMGAYKLAMGGDLQGTLAIGALFIGCSCLLITNYIRKFLGISAALIVLIILYWNSALIHIPTMMSENNGLIFAPLAFVLLCQAALKLSKPIFCFGMFVLTVGLNIRAGAFFIIPAILLWSFFYFETDEDKWSWKAPLYGIIGVIVGMFLPKLYQFLWGTGTNVVHSNVAYHLYAMSVGSREWSQIYTDLPELFQASNIQMDTKDCFYTIMKITLNNIIENPMSIIKLYSEDVFFTYIYHLFDSFNQLHSILKWFFMVGLAWIVFYQRKNKLSMLFLFSLIGIVLSSPLMIHYGGLRTFTATMPFEYIFLGIGVYIFQNFCMHFIPRISILYISIFCTSIKSFLRELSYSHFNNKAVSNG